MVRQAFDPPGNTRNLAVIKLQKQINNNNNNSLFKYLSCSPKPELNRLKISKNYSKVKINKENIPPTYNYTN